MCENVQINVLDFNRFTDFKRIIKVFRIIILTVLF